MKSDVSLGEDKSANRRDNPCVSVDGPLTIARTRCAACESSDLESLGSRNVRETSLEMALCRNCGLAFVNPMLTDEAKTRLQPDGRRLHRSRSSELDLQRALARSRRRAARWEYVIASQLRPGSRVLDVGAGDGALVELLLKHGHHPVAVDPDADACAFLSRKFNVETIARRVEEATADELGTFDAVFMVHLIEHLEDPTAVLARLASQSKEGGLLAIETPNILRVKVGPKRIFSLPHNFYFSPDSLLQLVAAQGFKPAHCRSFHLDMFHLTARRANDSSFQLSASRANADEVRCAIRHHAMRYYLRAQFLLRKLPWLRDYYVYGRYKDRYFAL